MAYLKVFGPDGEVRDIPLSGKRLIIGRDADYADYVLPDPAISRMHALILLSGSDYILKDMESTCGTFVDRKRVKETVLRDGQSIQIGSILMEFCHPVEDQDVGDAMLTIDGIAQRFRTLPAGMNLSCRTIYVPPSTVFSRGDTILIGSGGIRFRNPFSQGLEDEVLELELTWPNGNKKGFLGEVIQLYHDQLCVKLHNVVRADYERLLDKAKRSGWMTAVEG